MTNGSYEEAKQFVYELLTEGFTISQSAVRVALYPVPGDSNFPFAAAYLQSINGPASLRSHLSSMFYDGSTGQQLGMAINDVASDDFKNEGYRNRTLMPNHLVIYITGTSTFTGPGTPVVTAGALRGQGVYGFIVIRYKSTADPVPLQGIAGDGDCYMIAVDPSGLSGLKTRIQQKISDAYFTSNGVYCP